MTNMPFKLSYSFEGDYRRRPEQNLSGASRKETRELLLHRAHEERQKRQEERLKLKSTIIIQSYVRSYLIRKTKKHEERLRFDECENVLNLKELIGRLLFFYDPKLDNKRLLSICERLLQNHEEILKHIDFDNSLNWSIRRILNLCLNGLSQQEIFQISLQCITVFTENTNSRAKLEIWPYLVNKDQSNTDLSENEFKNHENEDRSHQDNQAADDNNKDKDVDFESSRSISEDDENQSQD